MKQVLNLKNNEGTVVTEKNNTPVAIYKDKAGKLHKLSPICPHKGCTVDWNDQQKEWSCPCHGSTFSPEGHVTAGPAQKDLTAIE